MGRIDAKQHLKSNSKKPQQNVQHADQTILVLKRVVEKLRAENKRLKELNISMPSSNDNLELSRMQQLYAESQNTISNLQRQIKDNDLLNELRSTKDQLSKKSHLLEKAKILLTRAAAKEKVLKEQLSLLKRKCSELQNFPVIDEISE